MNETGKNWRCKECQTCFQYFGDPRGAKCINCGSVHLFRYVTVSDALDVSVSEHIVLKAKDPSLPSKRKLRREVRKGLRLEGSGSGRVVDELRIIDDDAGNYEEKIVDVESGRVIRDVKEPLSRHRGGSEKLRISRSRDPAK